VNNFDEIFDKLFKSIEILKKSIEVISAQLKDSVRYNFKNNNNSQKQHSWQSAFLSFYQSTKQKD